MRRMNNLVTLFTAMTSFFFGSFLTTILLTADKCPTQKSGISKLEPHPELFLMVLVLSEPLNTERRNVMRNTWFRLGQPLQQPYYPEEFIYLPEYDKNGHLEMESVAAQANRHRIHLDWLDSLSKNNLRPNRNIKVKHFFAIGTAEMDPARRAELQRENKQHKDLLLLPRIQDTYANLTEKLLHSLDALTRLYDYSYLIKVDDDTYVKLDYLLNELVSYDRKLLRKLSEYKQQPVPQLYWGYFSGRSTIQTKGRWKEAKYVLANTYITYALGGGYVLSRKLCEYLTNSSHYLSAYVNEDVSVGTWLAPMRNVYRRHDIRFDTGYIPRKCKPQHMVLHKRTAEVMRDIYAGDVCTFEVRNEALLKRPAEYYYNWHKLADKCCDNLVA